MKQSVKFGWNGITVDGMFYKARYRLIHPVSTSNIPAGSIYITAANWKSFPAIQGLTITNESDSMTDYFRKDEILVSPLSLHYPAVKAALAAQDIHNEKLVTKRNARYDAIFANRKGLRRDEGETVGVAVRDSSNY